MDCKWNVRFILKGGLVESGILVCSEDTSDAVARKIVEGGENNFFGLKGYDGNLFIKVGEIIALEISIAPN